MDVVLEALRRVGPGTLSAVLAASLAAGRRFRPADCLDNCYSTSRARMMTCRSIVRRLRACSGSMRPPRLSLEAITLMEERVESAVARLVGDDAASIEVVTVWRGYSGPSRVRASLLVMDGAVEWAVVQLPPLQEGPRVLRAFIDGLALLMVKMYRVARLRLGWPLTPAPDEWVLEGVGLRIRARFTAGLLEEATVWLGDGDLDLHVLSRL